MFKRRQKPNIFVEKAEKIVMYVKYMPHFYAFSPQSWAFGLLKTRNAFSIQSNNKKFNVLFQYSYVGVVHNHSFFHVVYPEVRLINFLQIAVDIRCYA